MRSSPTRSLDAAEWAPLIAGRALILYIVTTEVVPRMHSGGGYAMLGAALIAVVGVVFWQLPNGALSRDGRRELYNPRD